MSEEEIFSQTYARAEPLDKDHVFVDTIHGHARAEHVDEDDVFINTYAGVEPIDAVMTEAMDISWQQGLSEIETFFDLKPDTQEVEAQAGDGGDDVVAREDDMVGADTAEDTETMSTEAQTPTAGSLTANAEAKEADEEPSSQLEIAVSAVLAEHDDPMDIDHVKSAPPSPNDATEPARSDQPHFTDYTAGADEEQRDAVSTEGEQDEAFALDRQRKDFMSIAFVVNTDEARQSPANQPNIGATEDQEPPVEPHFTSSPKQSTSKITQKSSFALCQLSAQPTTPNPSHTPPAGANMSPNHLHAELQAPSSDGKNSLMDEMRKEDEDAFPEPRRVSVDVAVKEGGEIADNGDGESSSTDDGESFVDALSSPVGLRERLTEAAAEGEGDDGRGGGIDGEGGVDDDVSMVLEDSSRGISAEAGYEILVDQDVMDVTKPTKAGATTERGGANGKIPQTRNTGGQAAAAEAVMEAKPEPQTAAENADHAREDEAKAQQHLLRRGQDAMSEDELASSSPQIVLRKGKAPMSDDGTDGAGKAKKAKPTTSDATEPRNYTTDQTADQTADHITEPDPESAQPPQPPQQTKPKQKKQRRTKAKINASKRPKKPPAGKHDTKAVGALELKGMSSSAILSAEREGLGADGEGGGVGRKTRAQVAAERKAVPNAREAVRARRRGG